MINYRISAWFCVLPAALGLLLFNLGALAQSSNDPAPSFSYTASTDGSRNTAGRMSSA
jgi:hypothetical protein